MQFSHVVVALGIANFAYGASNSVFYGAFTGKNEGGRGCGGSKISTVNQGKAGTSGCKNADGAQCVTLVGHTGTASKCKVLLYEDENCEGFEESNIFGQNGEFHNEPFKSFKAQCS